MGFWIVFTKKRIFYILTVVIVFGLLLAAGRTAYVSDYIKALAVPELELITGRKAAIGQISVNILPLFIEIDDAVISDGKGMQLLSVGRTKVYVSLSGLLSREIILKRITVRDTVARLDDKQVKEIAANVKKYLAVKREDTYKVSVRSVLLNNALFDFREGDDKITVKAEGAEALLHDGRSYKVLLRDIGVAAKGLPESTFSADSEFSVKEDTVSIKSLNIDADGSNIHASGQLASGSGSGELKAEANVLSESVRKFFGLKKKGEGSVSVAGNLTVKGFKSPADVFIDLKVKGDFYIETLMELLKVKERVEGRVTVEGEIRGPLNNLQATAKAGLRSGNLFGVSIDKVDCKVAYSDRKMHFSDGDAKLYGGSAKAEAMITLPVVNYYSFSVDAKGVNSKGIFELINWDPNIGEGKVDGHISSEGGKFNPQGNFSYSKDSGGIDVLKRINAVTGSFSMKDKVISFPKMEVSTGVSSVTASGSVDLNRNMLNFRGDGASSNVFDLTDPYFRAITGPGTFIASLSGPTSDPALEVRFASNDIKWNAGDMNLPNIMRSHTVSFNSVQGDVTYKKNLLTVNNFRAVAGGMTMTTKGRIGFRKAKHLFDIPSPEYDLRINFDNGDLKDLAAVIRGAPGMEGLFRTAFTLTGTGEKAKASGSFSASNIRIWDTHSLDKAEAQLSFEKGEFNFTSLVLKKGKGVVTARGMISMDRRYTVSAALKNLDLQDVIPSSWSSKLSERNLKALTLTDVSIEGKGAISRPELDINGLLRYRDPQRVQSSGYGKIHIGIREQNAALSGNFMGGKIIISGSATLNNKMPWRTDIEFKSARSDFFAALFLKDVPDDLLVNLKGYVKLWGDKENLSASVRIDKAYLYGYGYGFTNSKPLAVNLEEKVFTIDSFAMKNELAELRISGSATLGKSFNLAMDGASSLAPLRAMSRNIDQLKGDASFALALTGEWDKPRLNGRIDVVNGALGIKKIPHRLTGVNAKIVADGDRIVLEGARGTISGGDVVMNGALYLDKFKLKRFFLDSKYDNVTIAVSKNFWVHSDGNLSYQGTAESRNISGNIHISKAHYTERVDWKSRLIQASKSEALKLDLGNLDQTGLNIKVTGSNLSVDNNIMRAALKMDILVKGSVGQPSILGRIETTRGIVYFRNNEFTFLKGVVDFAKPGEIKPFFDVLAETRIKNYTVRFALDGYTDQFNLSLTSTPALDEGDILSLMAAGDLAKNLKGMQGGIGAGEATSFLTGKLQDVVEDRLKTITGLDRLQIDPSVSRKTGTVSPRVTISKRLISDKLYATYSTSADVEEGQIIKLEYMLNKHTSLVGVRDDTGGIGADIKFRFQFK
jgi:hypothetical protein